MTLSEAFSLSGKTAIVTGGGGDIGAAISGIYAEAGANVVVADLSADQAQVVAGKIGAGGGRAVARAVDVSNPASVDALVTSTVQEFGRLDVMVNNAGILVLRPILDISPEEFSQVLGVNLNGVMYGCQAAARVMEPGSVIVNMASGIIDRPSADRASYAASKGGVVQLTRAFATELGPAGIRVNGIAPGWVISGITRQSYIDQDGNLDEETFAARVSDRAAGSPLKTIVDADDIGYAALYLAAPAGKAYTGQILRTNGGTVMV